MNNASMQRALPLAVRSQAGWANMGQHLQHKLGNVEHCEHQSSYQHSDQTFPLCRVSAHLESCWKLSQRLERDYMMKKCG